MRIILIVIRNLFSASSFYMKLQKVSWAFLLPPKIRAMHTSRHSSWMSASFTSEMCLHRN